jgi:hypothetical protein
MLSVVIVAVENKQGTVPNGLGDDTSVASKVSADRRKRAAPVQTLRGRGAVVSPTLFSDFQPASFINYTARDSVCVGAIGHERLRGAFTGCCTYYHSPSNIARPLEAVISCSILADDEIEKLS